MRAFRRLIKAKMAPASNMAVTLLWSLLSAIIFVVVFGQKCCDLSLFNRGIDGSYVYNNPGQHKLFVTYMSVLRRCGHT